MCENLPIKDTYNDAIDQLEAEIVGGLAPVVCPITHLFAKGMYVRQIMLPKGVLATSKIHKTQHPFTISKGSVLINEGDGNWIEAIAPFTGITQPGTRRVVYAVEDTIWTTYHAYKTITGKENSLSNEEKEAISDRIEGRIIQKHNNKALNAIKKSKIWLS